MILILIIIHLLEVYFAAFVPGTVLCARERSDKYFARYEEIKNEYVYPTLFQKKKIWISLENYRRYGYWFPDLSKQFFSLEPQTLQLLSAFIH